MKRKTTESDLPYRWLPVVSCPEEDGIRFLEFDRSSFSKSCVLSNIGDAAVKYGPRV